MNRKPSKAPPHESPQRNKRAQSRWPTVERQLIESKVIAGSALEHLIRDNQDFSMLRAEEADDGLPFPPWLRVYWRKTHPELDFSGPRVGYPLILGNILNWMMHHQDLPTNETPRSNPKQPDQPARRN